MEGDLLNPLRLCLKCLSFIGLQKEDKFKLFIGIVLHILTLYAFVLGEGLNLRSVETLEERVESSSIFICSATISMKAINYVLYFEQIEELFENLKEIIELSSDIRFKNRRMVANVICKIINIFKIFMWSCSLTAIVGSVVTIWFKKLVYNVPYPFNINNWIGFGIAVIHQMITCANGVILVLCLDSLIVLFMGYVTGIMEELSLRLESIGISDEFGNDELEICINIHLKVKNLVSKIEKSFRFMLIIQGAASVLIICSNTFLASTAVGYSSFLRGATFCVSLFVENLIYCYFGQKMYDSSEKALDSIFHSQWYNTELKTKKNIIIFLENLKNPLKISIYGVYDLDLMMFRNIIDSSFSMFSVLRGIRA